MRLPLVDFAVKAQFGEFQDALYVRPRGLNIVRKAIQGSGAELKQTVGQNGQRCCFREHLQSTEFLLAELMLLYVVYKQQAEFVAAYF